MSEGEPGQVRVLVVDDDNDCATSLGFLLGIMGADVVLALTARSGAVMARDFKPHLALIDLDMPGADGCALVRALRFDGCNAHCVCVTGAVGSLHEERCVRAGFDQVLSKPMSMPELESILTVTRARVRAAQSEPRCAVGAESRVGRG